jgi:hypothetical protein
MTGLTTADVRPGDWFVTDPGGDLFWWIELGERLIDGHQARGKRWGHSGVASRWVIDPTVRDHSPNCLAVLSSAGHCTCGAPPSHTLMCVEAEPGGAVERPWRWEGRPHLWSTGTGLSVPDMAIDAIRYKGVGYAFEDYVAIAAHRYHLHPIDNALKDRIASNGHMICSQLTDQCAQDSGIHLFNDGRWPGYVTPLDLAILLGG